MLRRAPAGALADQAEAVRALEWVVCRAAVAEAPAGFPGVVAPTLQLLAEARVRAAEVCGKPAPGVVREPVRSPVAEELVVAPEAPVEAVAEELVLVSGAPVAEESRSRVELQRLPRESGTPLQPCCGGPAEVQARLRVEVEVEASAPLPEGFRVEALGPEPALWWKKKVCVPCSGSLRSSANQGKIQNRVWMCRHFNLG